MRTVYNQYDSLVKPLVKWLDDRGVVFRLDTRVTDLAFRRGAGGASVERIDYANQHGAGAIAVADGDLVVVTLGSMTEASSLGATNAVPELQTKVDGGAWSLWERIAEGRPAFGRPATFDDHVQASRWVSFTATMHDPELLRILRDRTGNVAGEGGLVTFPDSAWLASIVVPHQPHFVGQPKGVGVLWGYGLSVDALGDFVNKPMSACTGREIMTEILWHLRVRQEATRILETTICIPCMKPFITSQCLPRGPGDRPEVLPARTRGLAFVGQFCELPEDVVFTVEYSIRSAQTAVYGLPGLKREPPPVHHGAYDPRVFYRAFMALHDMPSKAVVEATEDGVGADPTRSRRESGVVTV